MARNRRGNAIRSRLQQQLGDWARRLLTDWAVLTWTADSTRVGPVPITALNWALVVVAVVVGYQLPQHRMWVALAGAVWLLATLVRAGVVMPRRRATLDAVYANLQKIAVLPTSTLSRPVSPSQYVTGVKWSSGRAFRSAQLTIGATCPAASAQLLRPTLERAIEQNAPAPAQQEWVFDWPKANTVEFTAVDSDDPRLTQQQVARRIGEAFKSLFRLTPRTAGDGYALDITGWSDETRADGHTVPIPTQMQFAAGSHDLTDPGFRDSIERGFDRLVSCPGEWIYQWDINSQLLGITRQARGSLPARRKLNERKFADDVRSAITKPGKDPVVAEVIDWVDEESDQPARISVDFGTLPLGERKLRDRFEDSLDALMQSRWPDARLLFDWQFDGGATRLDIESVRHDDDRAKRKSVEKKLRNVVESKFGRASTPVDCDILEWQEGLSATGEALPRVARVNFGSVDVNKRETRDEFQEHWDSLATHNDWHYAWKPAEGIVTMTAVPRLPEQLAFPSPGSPEFDESIRLARNGILRFGPQKGGGWLDWDLNETPHGLVGGKTGSGKSVALSIVLFYAMVLPDVYEVIVCDPKRTDFTWTPEFPSVVRFAATDTEIVAAVGLAKQSMDQRQTMLNKLQIRKLQWVRDRYATDPELEREHGPVPKRLILFFDEIADFLAKSSNSDIEELKDEARADLESIARLGRAIEVNIIAAAQKPDAKIISTQLRSQLGFRLGVGPLDQYESQQILNSDHGTRFPDAGTPKGRAWAYDPKNGYRQTQVMFLPDDTMVCPWDPALTLTGAKDMARDRLAELGFAQVMITNNDGGQEPRWVRVENDDDAPAADTADTAGPTPVELSEDATPVSMEKDTAPPIEPWAELTGATEQFEPDNEWAFDEAEPTGDTEPNLADPALGHHTASAVKPAHDDNLNDWPIPAPATTSAPSTASAANDPWSL
ncbi:FtsK/SpoIIIE domain-containing protein [Rhodococcus pyridinivorans]|uniref:FtsK/SpoIIIE domain-containing protein n=1 Tax=Rhodococcus pyridinivorans TaxID=103816 RepID=UPI0022846A9A|nr:FtsK/SpoIIIE domain-containing protein [Rhodococcus pyridinivorans]WAL49584.1 FtsK/SpoIIIE domain-containing protein [Rhodococcus pyridinivorans]